MHRRSAILAAVTLAFASFLAACALCACGAYSGGAASPPTGLDPGLYTCDREFADGACDLYDLKQSTDDRRWNCAAGGLSRGDLCSTGDVVGTCLVSLGADGTELTTYYATFATDPVADCQSRSGTWGAP